MRILMSTAEMAPYSKTGGLGDVLGALPHALARLGHEVWVTTPMYGSVKRHALGVPDSGRLFKVPVGGDWKEGQFVRVHGTPENLHIIGVDSLDYFGTRSGIYGDDRGGYGDNGARFTFLCRATLELLYRMVHMGMSPDVVHGHDWHTGLLHAFLGEGQGPGGWRRRPAMVFTIHNMAYQGVYGANDMIPVTRLPWSVLQVGKMEYHGNLNLMKGGLSYADIITTVSPGYAREIMTEEGGFGLHGRVSSRAFDTFGILNGIDTDVWNPAADPLIAAPFDADDLRGKAACKRALQAELGLPQRAEVPVIGVVSRLTGQKGIELILEILQPLLHNDVQVVVLGSGSAHYEQRFERAEAQRPDRMTAVLRYDEGLAHRIEAGADIFLMPSLFEPCGLNQLYSLRYGTVPVVRAVGGLDDTIEDYDFFTETGNGFKFESYDAQGLWWALSRALDLYWNHPDRFHALRTEGMREDHSWERAARNYEWVYEESVRRYHDRFSR